MASLNLAFFADSFSVCNARDLEVDLNAEFCLELCKNDVKVLFAETGEDHFSRFLVGGEAYGRIFAHDSAKAGSNLILFALLLDNDCH